MFISDFTYIRRVGVSYCYMIFLTFSILQYARISIDIIKILQFSQQICSNMFLIFFYRKFMKISIII